MARPIPRPEPVTSATWFWSNMGSTENRGKRALQQGERALSLAFRTLLTPDAALENCTSVQVKSPWNSITLWLTGFVRTASNSSYHRSRCPGFRQLSPAYLVEVEVPLVRRNFFAYVITVSLAAVSIAGCGGYSSSGNGPVAPYITTQPANQTVTAGQTATFTAAATGSPAPTVQWQVSSNGGGTFSNLSGATSTTLSFTTAGSQNGYKYQAVFTNSAGSATTASATLTISSA